MTIKAYLESLGNTADEVASSLKDQGIKGVRGDTCYCPIAIGIKKNCQGFARWIKVGPGRITFDDPQIIDPSMPEVISQFVNDFDKEKYPDLIEKNDNVLKAEMKLFFAQQDLEREKERSMK